MCLVWRLRKGWTCVVGIPVSLRQRLTFMRPNGWANAARKWRRRFDVVAEECAALTGKINNNKSRDRRDDGRPDARKRQDFASHRAGTDNIPLKRPRYCIVYTVNTTYTRPLVVVMTPRVSVVVNYSTSFTATSVFVIIIFRIAAHLRMHTFI